MTIDSIDGEIQDKENMEMIQAVTTPEFRIKDSDIPEVTLKLLTSTHEGVARAAGLLSKEDIKNIKTYVKKGLSLPTDRSGIEAYLGYSSAGITGLEPTDILQLYTAIKNHAMGWDNIEKDMIRQSIDLDSYASRIVSTGTDIISVINEMPIMDRIRQLGTISDEQLADITYENDDGEVAVALNEIFDSMKLDIEYRRNRTALLKKMLSDYRITLTGGILSNGTTADGLEPQIKTKTDLMEKHNLRETINDIECNIKTKKNEIKQLKADYDMYVGLAFTGAAGGLIGLSITGGIFGDKAETARKKKNKLVDEVRDLESQVTGKKNLQQSLEDLSDDFDDIGIRMLDAEQALNHLEFMWQTMLSKIEESQEQFSQVNEGRSLISFVNTFTRVIDPWKDVGNSAQELVVIINEALEEYRLIAYG